MTTVDSGEAFRSFHRRRPDQEKNGCDASMEAQSMHSEVQHKTLGRLVVILVVRLLPRPIDKAVVVSFKGPSSSHGRRAYEGKRNPRRTPEPKTEVALYESGSARLCSKFFLWEIKVESVFLCCAFPSYPLTCCGSLRAGLHDIDFYRAFRFVFVALMTKLINVGFPRVLEPLFVVLGATLNM